MKYIALLRGINVGGNNKIDMKELAKTFSRAKFTNISTYINTGNIIFDSVENNTEKVSNQIHKWIENDFHLDIPVLVKNSQDFLNIINQIPLELQNNKDQKTDIMFLWSEIDSEEIINQIGTNPKVDNIKYLPGALLWYLDKKDSNQSNLDKLVGTKLYKQMTVRNVNTVRKLANLLSDEGQ